MDTAASPCSSASSTAAAVTFSTESPLAIRISVCHILMCMAYTIEASGLTKAFGDHVVLDGLDLCVGAGEVFALLGPNGAGKTTTVRILTTLLKPDGGTARVAGHDVVRDADAVRAA